MELTQDQLKRVSKFERFTRDSFLHEGMHIYVLLKEENGKLRYISHDVVADPTDSDWDEWEHYPGHEGRNRYDEIEDDYFTFIDADYPNERQLMTEDEYRDSLLEIPEKRSGKFIVTYEG